MTGLIARLEIATAEYCANLLHSYPEGKNDIFYTEGIEFQFSTLTISLDTDLKERSPTAALERSLCGGLFAKRAVTDTSHSDSE